MRVALFFIVLGLFAPRLWAEDWSTTDGKTYKNVQVLSHNVAYVTILYKDGGGRISLSVLGSDLQKRFGYDPTKAPAIIAATQAADLRDKHRLAEEKSRSQAEEAQRMKAVADAMAIALFSPAAETGPASSSGSPSGDEGLVGGPAIDSEPPTEIDDWDSGDGGDYGSYGYGYGYEYVGYRNHRGYRSYQHYPGGWGSRYVRQDFNHR